MIELTEEQRQELSDAEPIAIDPSTKETYVLVRKNVYDRIKGLLYDDGEWTEEELRLLLGAIRRGERLERARDGRLRSIRR